jgi:hypothetical protein
MKIKEFINEMVTSAATGADNTIFQRLFTQRALSLNSFIKFKKDKKKKRITEEFHDYIKRGNNTYEIIKTPLSSKDIKYLKSLKEIRFIADPNIKVVYFFDAEDLIHYDVYPSLNMNSDKEIYGSFSGNCNYRNNSFYVNRSDRLAVIYHFLRDNISEYKKIKNTNWDFVEKYVKGSKNFINNFIEKCEKRIKEEKLKS